MAQYDVTGPDGKTYTVNAPDGASQDDAIAFVKQSYYDKPTAPVVAQDPSKVSPAVNSDAISQGARNNALAGIPDSLLQSGKDLLGGAVRGAGSIGATILYPVDKALDVYHGDRDQGQSRNEERRQEMTQGLRELGADPDSTMFGIGKLGAEIAGTAGIPLAAGRGVAALAPSAPAVQAIASAIESGGLSVGPYATKAPGVVNAIVQGARNAGVRTAGGAISGALTAGAINPSDALTGAGVGAVLPNAVQTAGALGSVVRKGAAAISGGAAENNALQKIADTLGEKNVPQAIADIQTYYPKGAESIPVSAAGITQNPALAQLEQGSRVRSSPLWSEFDQRQGKAIADNVTQATQGADSIGQLLQQRADNWTANWDGASSNIKPRVWTQRMNKFSDDLGTATQMAESSNPDVLKVVQGIQSEMDRLGPNFGPGNLQQIRANLSGKYDPTSTNPFKSAPRDSMAVNTIKSEIDDILNASTGNKWQKVLDGYTADSRGIDAANAARTVRNSFWDEQTGRVLGKSRDTMGDVPSISEMNLGTALNKARLPDKSLALDDAANQRLEATLAAIRRQNMLQGLKRTATAGGGSDTASNFAADAMAHSVHAPSLVLQLASAVRSLATGKTDAQMARLLSNPDDLAQGLGALSQAFNRQPSPMGQALYRAAPLLGNRTD